MPTKVTIITGSRAEFGLLLPVLQAARKQRRLAVSVIATGAHLLRTIGGGRATVSEVRAACGRGVPLVEVVMQRDSDGRTRAADVQSVGRGVAGIGLALTKLDPDWVVVLGDRIEAFAGATAGAIGGRGVCHIHGGDRAEGVADESMRHAISKLAHLHCVASKESARRLIRMGEDPRRIIRTGSPAIDGLAEMARAHRPTLAEAPDVVLLLHPAGLGEAKERAFARAVIKACQGAAARGVVALLPNQDAGRDVIAAELMAVRLRSGQAPWMVGEHLPRATFVGLLAGLRQHGGVLVGNSSAGLIEAAALGVNVVNVGPRQAGRQRAGNVIDVTAPSAAEIERAMERAAKRRVPPSGVFGDGKAGSRIAKLLLRALNEAEKRKRNAY